MVTAFMGLTSSRDVTGLAHAINLKRITSNLFPVHRPDGRSTRSPLPCRHLARPWTAVALQHQTVLGAVAAVHAGSPTCCSHMSERPQQTCRWTRTVHRPNQGYRQGLRSAAV